MAVRLREQIQSYSMAMAMTMALRLTVAVALTEIMTLAVAVSLSMRLGLGMGMGMAETVRMRMRVSVHLGQTDSVMTRMVICSRIWGQPVMWRLYTVTVYTVLSAVYLRSLSMRSTIYLMRCCQSRSGSGWRQPIRTHARCRGMRV